MDIENPPNLNGFQGVRGSNLRVPTIFVECLVFPPCVLQDPALLPLWR